MSESFERDKICYEQHSESFRSLNNQMWQVPIIAMTLTGGLWFGIFSTKIEADVAAMLLLFCFVCDTLFILILFRVRLIMSLLIDRLTQFNPSYSISPSESHKGNYVTRQDNLVICLFSIMLLLAALISLTTSLHYICKT